MKAYVIKYDDYNYGVDYPFGAFKNEHHAKYWNDIQNTDKTETEIEIYNLYDDPYAVAVIDLNTEKILYWDDKVYESSEGFPEFKQGQRGVYLEVSVLLGPYEQMINGVFTILKTWKEENPEVLKLLVVPESQKKPRSVADSFENTIDVKEGTTHLIRFPDGEIWSVVCNKDTKSLLRVNEEDLGGLEFEHIYTHGKTDEF